MEITERLSFNHAGREDLYRYVEQHGTVRESAARRALNMDQTEFGHHMTVLQRDGYIRREDGKLSVAYGEEESREHTADGTEYRIRQATQEDLTGVVKAIRRVAGDGSYIEAETVADVVETEEVVLRHNQLGSRLFFVAVVDDDVVGWVHLDLPEAKKLAHTAVLTVGLLSEHRGKGIGGELLARGEEWASEQGFEKLYNSVPSTNDHAIEFLEAQGWETEAIRADHYYIDDEYVDEVMMAKRLG